MLLATDRPATTAARSGAPGLPRRLRPVVDALAARTGRAPRALVVGTAGSGKTALLQRLQDALAAGERDVAAMPDTAGEIVRLPAAHVLLVDDLHLLRPELLAAVRRRADDPGAGLIVASRPWPTTDATVTIARLLEHTQPAIVLGHVSRSDVLDDLETRRRSIPTACVDRILEVTDGVSWLVAEAIAAHDERDCVDDASHRALSRVLDDRVAHRLETVDADIRTFVERRCLVAAHGPAPADDEGDDELALRAYAEGLLLRGGRPAPAVRSAVRSAASAQTIALLTAELGDGLTLAVASDDPDYAAMLSRLHTPGLGAALADQGDRLLDSHPERAQELYQAAWDAGLQTTAVLERRAQAAWVVGDLDEAAVLTEAARARVDDEAGTGDSGALEHAEPLTDLAAAVWAARGMMAQSAATYRAMPPRTATASARATIAALGVGDGATLAAAKTEPDGLAAMPSTLGTAMSLVDRGLRATLAADATDTVLVDLIRASEMYTSARASAPIAEPPAVIAAIVALNLGDTVTAQSVVDDAIAGGHGGQWARPRLLLWRAWIAVQRVRPHDARLALAQAEAQPGARSPRDRLLARAVEVALARRYGDAADLAAAWRTAHTALLRVDVDAFLFLPLTELVCAAAKTGDADRAAQALERALEVADGLGGSPLWTAAVRWAGVQRSILLGRPDELIPHAHALVAAGHHSAVAAAMAKAGRIWTSVLAGTVDPDAVEAAAQQLASYGMAWDAARLAGHGAARSTDRRVSARLLARARELHPIELERTTAPASGEPATRAESDASPAAEVLSEREREVARLVLQGKTYAEIGEAIFISPRTAEHHIAHIRRRLGATSRSDVIAKLRLLMSEPATTADAPGTETDADPHRAA
ncbi:DNA-binding CsgD family transcriptional regulator [Microbacterium trichothecenolyticum]|uniref:helix-turn-helix transcriptional regulator n=1 Tax=Microbacterium trichothecenolyticum TaxID=69370 RepID=UPI0028545524|nr:LuxR C-terminal-related transcriptional regulator [Microbacterium trichothecenolyticum]MDR7184958.1 DNA-binding CsgD family transcriptional regulator [Microbacterium trichothecenolyticum]